MTIKLARDAFSFEHEITGFSITDSISAMLTGGYIDSGLIKGKLYEMEINDGNSTIEKTVSFQGYQFSMQTITYIENGESVTKDMVTNNSLTFDLVD